MYVGDKGPFCEVCYGTILLAIDEATSDHAAEVERLTAERDALKSIVNACMGILGMTQTAWDGTDIPRGESDLPRWVRDVADASYRKGKERDAAVARARQLEVSLKEAAGSLDTIAEKSGRYELLNDMGQVRQYAHGRANVARAALAAAPDKPQYAALELVPVYPGPDLQRGDIVYTPKGERTEVYGVSEDNGVRTSKGTFCASELWREKNAALAQEPWGGPEG